MSNSSSQLMIVHPFYEGLVVSGMHTQILLRFFLSSPSFFCIAQDTSSGEGGVNQFFFYFFILVSVVLVVLAVGAYISHPSGKILPLPLGIMSGDSIEVSGLVLAPVDNVFLNFEGKLPFAFGHLNY